MPLALQTQCLACSRWCFNRSQTRTSTIWYNLICIYIYRQNQIDNAIHVIDTRLQDQAKSAQIIRFVMASNCRVEVLICGMSLGVYFGSIWVLQDYESVTGHRLGHRSVSWHSSRRHKAVLPSISSNRPCHQTLLHSMCIYHIYIYVSNVCMLKRIYIYTYIDIDIFYMHICCIYIYKVILLAPG